VSQVIELHTYDEKWETIFLEMKQIYETALGDLAVAIEHIGSTSVPGLSAKPILDIDIVIKDANNLPKVNKVLERLGYFHQGNLGIDGRESFRTLDSKSPLDDKGTRWMNHHLYVCSQNSREFMRHIAFRDYLKEHHNAAKAYEKLKLDLAISVETREEYTEGKTAFIEMILQKSLKND
jgi:GrpB-like predicted nucleotidyltransferase (UPF0157 family)